MGFGINLGVNLNDTWNQITGQAGKRDSKQRQHESQIQSDNEQIAWREFKRNKQETDRLWSRDVRHAENLWNKQATYNQKLWEQQNARNDMMWHRQNEYNSPAEQMKRLQEAGLNPKLMYGQGTTGNTSIVNSKPIETSRYAEPTSHRATYNIPKKRSTDIAGIRARQFDHTMQMVQLGLTARNMMIHNRLLKEQQRSKSLDVAIKAHELNLMKKGGYSRWDPPYYRLGARFFSDNNRNKANEFWKHYGGRILDVFDRLHEQADRDYNKLNLQKYKGKRWKDYEIIGVDINKKIKR